MEKYEYLSNENSKLIDADKQHIDLVRMSKSETFRSVIKAYEEEFLFNCNIEKKWISEEEVILVVEDELIVDFFLSQHSFGEQISGNIIEKSDYYYIVIQELTHNSLFSFNHAGFRRKFKFGCCTIEFLKFRGIDSYRKEIDRFPIINNLLPELRLMERYDAYPGELYHFVIFEMKDVNGNVGLGIGYTKTAVHKFVLKVGSELENKNSRTLVLNGSSSLDYRLSQDFVNAFLSWNGKKKVWRLENQLTYYYVDIHVKEETDLYSLPSKILNNAHLGKYDMLERGRYKKPLNRWKTEELVYNIVKKLYRQYKVVYQYHPYYLKTAKGSMSYDVYICGLKTAIEYQGKQHFEPIEYFGGKEHYEKQVERDKYKQRISKENGVKLIYINYWEDVTPDLIIEKIGIKPGEVETTEG